MNKALGKLPPIGLRILKSAIAVFLCFIFYHFFRPSGIMFYSQLSVLWCIQPQRENMLSKALQRTVGTLVGALFGLLVLLIDIHILSTNQVLSSYSEYFYALLVSITIILVLYVTVLIKKKDASYFSCVVLLSIVIVHIGDASPFLFVFNRVLDTMIGIIIGMSVNSFRLPYKKQKDILFVSGMDDTLISTSEQLSPYSIVEINRMLNDGAQFTVSTKRTPASLIEPLRGIHLKLPVIAMDGAVMYDINKHTYLHSYILSKELTSELCTFLDQFQINYFINALIDDILVIQYKELINETEKKIYEQLHESPFRNYTKCDVSGISHCIYIMLIQPKDQIDEIYKALQKVTFYSQIRISSYDSMDYPGYAYIKIYNANATRENMLSYLKQMTGLTKVVTFGSIEGKYDVVIKEYDNNKVAHTLRKMYEPNIFEQ